MIINDNFNLSYDLSGNLILTIPKAYIQNSEPKVLLKTVERLIKSETEKMKNSPCWNEDSAIDVVGICQSDINDGSIYHDRDIYGL